MKKNEQRGFTLIELLVVIAIIGLLASVVYATLGGARKKGRIAAAQSALRGMVPALSACLNDDLDITPAAGTAPTPAGATCANQSAWPALPPGWSYTTAWTSTKGVSFKVVATSAGDSTTITCTESGCTTTP